jgi:hypothetical protein
MAIPISCITNLVSIKNAKPKIVSRAKTQRRKEDQGHNFGALSRVKTFSKPIGFICFKVLTGEAGKN